MRHAVFLTLAALLLAAPSHAQKPGNWGYLPQAVGEVQKNDCVLTAAG
jgi:hypothetical protein